MEQERIIMSAITATKARNEFSSILRRAARKKERVVLTRRGKKLAALVPIEDLNRLECLSEKEEDRLDREALKAARAELKAGARPIPLSVVKKKLGL